MYKIRISSRAGKQIKGLPDRIQRAIVESLHELKYDPYLEKKLSRELTGRYSLKVGAYRVIYKINEKDKIVNILSAGHRATVYD